MRHTFESGEWVDLLPIQDLKVKHRDKLIETANYGAALNDDGEVDRAAIAATPGGPARYWLRYQRRRRDITVALVVQAWSYPVPVPEVTPDGELINADSVGETDAELVHLIEPYLDKLSRDPDP